jgi:hypothetical protein
MVVGARPGQDRESSGHAWRGTCVRSRTMANRATRAQAGTLADARARKRAGGSRSPADAPQSRDPHFYLMTDGLQDDSIVTFMALTG